MAEDRLLQFFVYAHLPAHLQAVSAQFGLVAAWVDEHLPAGPERTVCLRKLLEAKDCAVRTMLEYQAYVEAQADMLAEVQDVAPSAPPEFPRG